ncbi:histidine phosphatase family protein [Candidatus Lokiarchaeum ossiferum]|uniref:histidine phosphatase family protein n=1 Tax=Candidatus Lokiarchaeum ossiferum TaxID=2951803 RepID=UPI00352CB757
MTKLIIIQHCQSEHHINNMSGGWTDTPLTPLGRKQADLIGKRLKLKISDEKYGLYSSDLKRAYRTAEIIGKHLNLEITIDKELREINTGIAAGKTKDWANAHRNPRKEKGFNLDYQEFPQGETWKQFYFRVCNCMERITKSENNNYIIVTHGCTLAYIVAWWLKYDLQMLVWSYFSASPASISILQYNAVYCQNVLKLFNDTSHLKELVK